MVREYTDTDRIRTEAAGGLLGARGTDIVCTYDRNPYVRCDSLLNSHCKNTKFTSADNGGESEDFGWGRK